MTDEHENRIYQGVRRMVIWDEPRADVFHRLQVNGIDAPKAQQMYDKARAERLAIIRADSIKQAALGLVLLFAAASLLLGFWIGLRVMLNSVLALGGAAAVFGTWHFSKGLFYVFFAHTKEGSLANDD